jgi:hypothetical protein
VCQHRLEAVRKLLDRAVERKAPQLGQSRAVDRRSEAKATKLLEALLGRHALVQQECVVPCLSGAGEVVGGHPRPLLHRSALAQKNCSQCVSQFSGSTEPSYVAKSIL